MTTSRTGTTTYLRNSERAKRQARASGLTHCPECGVELDYDTARLPNSAESDHIVEWAKGGTDALANLRVICRDCNLKRNRKVPSAPVPPAEDFPTSRHW